MARRLLRAAHGDGPAYETKPTCFLTSLFDPPGELFSLFSISTTWFLTVRGRLFTLRGRRTLFSLCVTGRSRSARWNAAPDSRAGSVRRVAQRGVSGRRGWEPTRDETSR